MGKIFCDGHVPFGECGLRPSQHIGPRWISVAGFCTKKKIELILCMGFSACLHTGARHTEGCARLGPLDETLGEREAVRESMRLVEHGSFIDFFGSNMLLLPLVIL